MQELSYIESQIQSLLSDVELQQLEGQLERLEQAKQSDKYMSNDDFFDAFLSEDEDKNEDKDEGKLRRRQTSSPSIEF